MSEEQIREEIEEAKGGRVVVVYILLTLMLVIGYAGCLFSQEYTASARLDLLSSGGYEYPKKGLGSIHGTDYRFGKKKWGAMLMICGAGLIDGIVEGYEFDSRLSFERKWNVDPYSYFGSRSWDSEWNGYERFKRSQVDFYHTADDARKLGYVTGGFMLGRASLNNTRKIHNVYDIAIVSIASGFWKSLGLQWVRDQLKIKLF